MPILRHHLQHALAERLDVVRARPSPGSTPVSAPCADQVLDRLEGQVRVDRGGAVAEQQRDVVHLAAVAGLDDQRRPGCGSSRAPGGGARRRSAAATGSARSFCVAVAVGQHDDPRAVRDRLGDLGRADLDRPSRQRRSPPPATSYRPGDPDGGEAGQVAVVVDVQDLGQLVVVDDRERQERPAGSDAGPGSSRFCSGPMVRPRLVTSSSRMASSGGLVTCANSWLK